MKAVAIIAMLLVALVGCSFEIPTETKRDDTWFEVPENHLTPQVPE